MILRRLTNAFRRQDWFTVFIETLIVVLGVFLGLQVNNWNTTRSDSRREMAYLNGLHDDFSQIITELQSDSAEYEDIAAAMTLLIDQSRKDAPDVPLETLNTSAAKLVRMVGTPIVSDTYANLTGSGDLAIIKNPRIKIALASFYGQVEVINLVDNTHEMQLVNIFQPYIIDHLDYTLMFRDDRELPMSPGDDPDRILTVLTTPEFRNIAATKWDIATDIHNLLGTALDEARTVEALLDEELERRQ